MKPITILLIEDHDTLPQMLAQFLSAIPYELTRTTPAKTFDLFSSSAADLILMVMSDVAELDIIAQIRVTESLLRRPTVPVLVLTQHDSPENIALAIHAGADDLLSIDAPVVTLDAKIVSLLRTATNLKQLTEEKNTFEHIFESVSEGIHVLNLNGIIIAENTTSTSLLGWKGDDSLIGKHAHTTMHHHHADHSTFPVCDCPIYKTLHDGIARHVEDDVFWRRDNTSFPVEYKAAPLRTNLGEIYGVTVVFQDISERKAMLKLAEIRENELRISKDQAEKAAKAKSEFLSNMSHEIRTPMNAIMGMAHLLARTELSSKQLNYVSKINLSSHHLLGVLNDILDFSKIESGKLAVESVAFSFDSLLQNLLTVIAERAHEKNLEFIFDISPEVPPHLIGDSLRLSQILINYANNAIKFTQHGEISLIVKPISSNAEMDTDKVMLKFELRDTGIGLSDEQIARLFQKFSQADQSTTRQYGGTGLGLAISKSLAELMGGQVGVESQVGVGSTFWFTAILGIDRSAPIRAKPLLNLQERRVLVVDDNNHAAEVLVDMLKSIGCKTSAVASGAEAISAVSQASQQGSPFDVVLLDWQMPGMDGLETAKRINQLNISYQPQKIMVTAYGREEVMQGAHHAGIQDVLLKPVNPSTLLETMSKLLCTVEVSSELSSTEQALPPDILARHGARILLVEDNELNQEIASEILQDAGFVVDVADNGQIALDLVQKCAYNLVLMDMQMPVMDGVTATQHIRQLSHFATLPILAMTANAMQADKDRCLSAGMNGFISKPIDMDELWTALIAWIKPTSAPSQTAS